MDAVEYQRKRVGDAKDALNKAFDSLGQINGRTYGGW
jgi:hypothetical protein